MRGLQLRLNRLQSNGYYSILAADHGLSQGLVSGIETLSDLESLFQKGASAGMRGIVLNYGAARQLRTDIFSEVSREMALIVQVYGRAAKGIYGGNRHPLCSIEDAIAVGADGVAFQIDLAQSVPEINFRELGELASRSRVLGIPSLLMVGGIRTNSVPEFLSIARSLTELPVDLLKMDPGGLVHQLNQNSLRGFPLPCLYAGGDVTPSFRDNMRAARRAGFGGICIGRNYFQSESGMAVARDMRSALLDPVL